MFRFCIKLFFLGVLLCITVSISVTAQVGVGISIPDPSALLDVSSTSKGVLIPRLTATEKSQISNPATGLLIYQTNDSTGFYYYSGSGWVRILSQNALPANITAQGNSFNTAGKLVQLNGTSQLPAVDGSLLTNLSAGKISGVIPVTKGGTGSDSAFNRGSIVFADSTGKYRQNNDNFFWSNDSLRLGIGTRNPYSRLSLGHGASNKADSRIAVYEDEAYKGKYFYGLGLSDRFGMYGLGLWGGTGNALPGNGNDSTVAPHVMISSFGYVGIGTMTPDTRLSVSGKVSAADLRLYTGAAPNKILTSIDSLGNTKWSAPDQLSFNAGTITSGTLNNARLSAQVTQQGNTFNTAGKLLQLDSTGKLPALDGSRLTNLTLGNLSLNNMQDTLSVIKGGTGTGAAFTKGSLIFAGNGGKYEQNNNKLFWDNDSARLGLGTNATFSALSFGMSNPNSLRSRIALYEQSNGRFFYGLGFIKYDSYFGLGFWGGTGNARPGDGFDSTKAPQLYLSNNGNVGVGNMMPAARLDVGGTVKATALDVTGNVKAAALQLPTGAVAGHMLKSDAQGNAVWIDPAFMWHAGDNPFYVTYPQKYGGEFSAFHTIYTSGAYTQCTAGTIRRTPYLSSANSAIERVIFNITSSSSAPIKVGFRIVRITDSVTLFQEEQTITPGVNSWYPGGNVYLEGMTSYYLYVYKPASIPDSICYTWEDASFDIKIRSTQTADALKIDGGVTTVNGRLAVNGTATASAISLGASTENTPSGQIAVYEGGTDGRYFYGMNLAKVGNNFGLGLYGSSGTDKPGNGTAAGTRKPHLFISQANNLIEADLPAQFNGNVAIKGQLDLYGGVRFWDGASWRSLTIGNCGTCTQVGYWTTSDRRFKTGIRSLGYSALDRISRINGYRYSYRNDSLLAHGYGIDSSNREQLGFIAQEIEPLFPELVKTDSAGYKAVNYAQMTAVLVEAIKELRSENIQLKSDYNVLKAGVTSRISELEEKLETLLQQPSPGKIAAVKQVR